MKTGYKILIAGASVLVLGILKTASPLTIGRPFLAQEFFIWAVISAFVFAIGGAMLLFERKER
ncbi:MAG: hypothetical protein ACYCX2_04815 [Christensenellales bacterium]